MLFTHIDGKAMDACSVVWTGSRVDIVEWTQWRHAVASDMSKLMGARDEVSEVNE